MTRGDQTSSSVCAQRDPRTGTGQPRARVVASVPHGRTGTSKCLQPQARTAPGLPLSDRTEQVDLRNACSNREGADPSTDSALRSRCLSDDQSTKLAGTSLIVAQWVNRVVRGASSDSSFPLALCLGVNRGVAQRRTGYSPQVVMHGLVGLDGEAQGRNSSRATRDDRASPVWSGEPGPAVRAALTGAAPGCPGRPTAPRPNPARASGQGPGRRGVHQPVPAPCPDTLLTRPQPLC
jgi:hypothetical protein